MQTWYLIGCDHRKVFTSYPFIADMGCGHHCTPVEHRGSLQPEAKVLEKKVFKRYEDAEAYFHSKEFTEKHGNVEWGDF